MAQQLQTCLDHSGQCIALAHELNAKLRDIEVLTNVAMVTGDEGAQRLAERIANVIQGNV